MRGSDWTALGIAPARFEIGSYAMVGAGSLVTEDVPAYALMVGVPARRIGYVCACGERLPDGLACTCGLSYQSVGGALAPSDVL